MIGFSQADLPAFVSIHEWQWHKLRSVLPIVAYDLLLTSSFIRSGKVGTSSSSAPAAPGPA